MEALEYTPDVRMIVDADHDHALAPPHEVSHLLVLLEREFDPLSLGLPVRRIHVEERVQPVVPFDAVKPRHALNVGVGKPLPGCRRILFNAQQVDRRSCGRGTKRLPSGLDTEGVLLEVEELHSAQDVRKRLRPDHFLPLEDLPGAERLLGLAYERLEEVLDDAVERH